MSHTLVKFFLIFNFIARIWTHNSTENTSGREHKVHNIVLYPDKHSWCKATPIVQVVSHAGYIAIKTDNNVCVGACFSYVVPRTIPETLGDVLPYCDSCQPGHITWRKVTLQSLDKNQNLTKYVEYIHDCNCGSCHEVNSGKLPQEDGEMENSSSEDSLMNEYSLNSTSEANQILSNSSESEFKTIIPGILNSLNNEDESVLENTESKGLHRNVWKSLLEKVETTNNSMDTSKFNALVKSVEDELKVKFNYKRLKLALLKLKKYENITKITNFALNMSSDSTDSLKENELLASRYSKNHGIIQHETASHGINFASQFRKPSATTDLEISNQDNIVKSAIPAAENQTVTGGH